MDMCQLLNQTAGDDMKVGETNGGSVSAPQTDGGPVSDDGVSAAG